MQVDYRLRLHRKRNVNVLLLSKELCIELFLNPGNDETSDSHTFIQTDCTYRSNLTVPVHET